MARDAFTFKASVPTVNTNWWASSRRQLNEVVERYNRSMWPQQRSPLDQQPWAPRKPPTGNWPLLRLTGKMQDTAKFYTRPGRVGEFFASTVYYGPFLQYGTKYMPPRVWLAIGPKILPAMERVVGSNLFRKRQVRIDSRKFK